MEQNSHSNLIPESGAGKRRIIFIDYFRGIALIYMIFYHTLFDLAYVVPKEWGRALYYANEDIVIFDTSSFILLAGISCAFSRSKGRYTQERRQCRTCKSHTQSGQGRRVHIRRDTAAVRRQSPHTGAYPSAEGDSRLNGPRAFRPRHIAAARHQTGRRQ